MPFKVVYDAEGTTEELGDKDRYHFDDHGLLIIEGGDGMRCTLSPQAWKYVEEQRGKGAGYQAF